MKKKSHQRLLSAGLLMAVLAYGCQVPLQSEVGHPRTIVYYSGMQFAPDADLAISLDFKALLSTGYKVQSVTAGSVAKIVAKVSGPRLAEPVTTSVDVINCPDGTATLNFTHLPPGKVDIVVNAVDHAGNVVAWASNSKPVTIEPGKTAVVPLTCSTETGGLTIVFECGDCEPDASPTPPPPALSTGDLLSTVHGFAADKQGNVYLMGWDSDWTGSWNSNSYTGRLVKVPHDLSGPASTFYDDLISNIGAYGRDVLYDGEMVGDHFFIRKEGGAMLDFNLPAGTHEVKSGSVNRNLAYRESSGDFWMADWPGAWIIISSFNGWTKRMAYNNNNPDLGSGDYRPALRQFGFDSNGQPLWAAHKGIVTFQKTFTGTETLGYSEPKLLLDFENVAGLVRADDVSSRHFFFSRENDTKIYLWNQDGASFDPAASVVADSAPYFPIRLEKDNAGHYYALAFKESSLSGAKEYQVIKYRFNNGQLEKVLLMVDTVL